MKTLIKLEELAQFAAVTAYLYLQDAPWYIYLCLLIAPDISMLGYLLGNKTGAWMYNFAHHKGVALALVFAGWGINEPWLMTAGLVLFGHASLDRVFGYGLKLEEGFHHTHLGRIGKQ